jgi:hypothetical protein
MLCWTLCYYCRGNTPVAPPSHSLASSGSSSGGGGSSGGTPYASWQCFYEHHHYAPLASDLAKFGRELKGAMAAASRASSPIHPFAQLMLVLPFSRCTCR